MGNTNTLPVISQTKSLVQLATGDKEGARATQEKFFHECPIVAQATSAVEYAIDRDVERMKETNKRSVKVISNFTDGIPVVGHVKGGIHALAGDTDGAKQAVKSANRSVGVVGGGAVGFLAGGFPGAIAGGIAGGAAMDGLQTGISSAYHKEFRPAGSIAAVKQAIDNPSGGAVFDAVAVPVFDGVAGYGAGQLTAQIQAGGVLADIGHADVGHADANPTDLGGPQIRSPCKVTLESQTESHKSVIESRMTSAQLASDGVIQSEAAAIAAEASEAVAAEAAAAQQQQTAAAAGAAAVEPGSGNQLQQIGDAIVTKKTDIVKAAVDPRGGSVDVPKSASKFGLDALKSIPKSAKWNTVQTVSATQIQQLLDALKTVDKILATTKDLTTIATGRQIDVLAPGLSFPLKTILSEIIRFVGTNVPRREEILERTAQLASRIRDMTTRSTPEPVAANGRGAQLRCVHWNMSEVSADLIDHIGLVWYLVLDSPDVLLLNHVTASEHLMNALTNVLGYRFLLVQSISDVRISKRNVNCSKFPSASVIEDEDDEAEGRVTSGSALLFRPREGIACVGAGSLGGDGAGHELVWIDVQQQDPVGDDQVTLGPICRLLNVQCDGGDNINEVASSIKKLSGECTTVICATVPRPTRQALMEECGLVKCSSDSDSYDAILTPSAGRQHVICHRSPPPHPSSSSSESAAAAMISLSRAQPFTVGEEINREGAIGCEDKHCYYGCSL
ncbi:hypothetical protein PMAYCL1PPCAC_18978 [Pristionchus mayeri]|uniref:Uncharacterized protein n=1 Tax=Pristionchus mayeri TaxID=1317129 RepID=A0AAN5CQH0_9BILA|nr:hypothetical protein PMAYCL1PPCAC_18978 [Pristionchus mayeri]